MFPVNIWRARNFYENLIKNKLIEKGPMFSDEEIKKLTASTTFTEEELRKFEACQDQYTKESLIRLVEGAYIPQQRKPIYVGHLCRKRKSCDQLIRHCN